VPKLTSLASGRGRQQRQTTSVALDAAASAQQQARAAAASSSAPPPPPPMGAAVEGTAADDAATECVICMSEKRECVFVPCGHVACCEQCAGSLVTCPICRVAVERSVKMYDS